MKKLQKWRIKLSELKMGKYTNDSKGVSGWIEGLH